MTDPSARSDALSDLLDRAAITQVVNDWGLCRDTGRWDGLQACFAENAVMYTTWFVGPAIEFIARSKAAGAAGARVQHFIGAATINLAGDRAISETRMILMARARLGDVPVDVTCYGRFHDHFVRIDGGWKILQRVPIYEKDRLDPVEPGRAVTLDAERLAGFAEGYRHLVYVQSLGGAVLPKELPVPGSSDEAALLEKGLAWLKM